MPKFSKSSLDKLSTCDPRLQKLFLEVIKCCDCTILEGFRGEGLQHKYYLEGKSKKDWPTGEHNKTPSMAIDAAPYPISWLDIDRGDKWAINQLYAFGGLVLGIAYMMEIPIRWGGDWDGDWTFTDQTFHDLPHFELLEKGGS